MNTSFTRSTASVAISTELLDDAAGAAGDVTADDGGDVFDDVRRLFDGIDRDVPDRVDGIFGI